jgi:hypothetical protein
MLIDDLVYININIINIINISPYTFYNTLSTIDIDEGKLYYQYRCNT